MAYGDSPWSNYDDNIIREHYYERGSAYCATLLNGRTPKAVACRAAKLGIKRNPSRELVHVNEALILQQYASLKDQKRVAAVLGIGIHLVTRTLRKHKIGRIYYHSIDERRDAIVADYQAAVLTNRQLCAVHNVSKTELTRALKRWGVHDPHRKSRLIQNGSVKLHGKSAYQCWTEKLGKEEADRRLHAWKESRVGMSAGARNPMFGKPTPQGAGNGWKGWYRGRYFRSLRELSFMADLDGKGIEWHSGETLRIPYKFDGRDRTYRPDFLVGKEVVEIKPLRLHNSPSVKAKERAVTSFCEAHGLSYRVVDVEIDHERVYRLYREEEIRFDRDYEDRFLEYRAKQGFEAHRASFQNVAVAS